MSPSPVSTSAERTELIRRLRHLISLNAPRNGVPYLFAAQACVQAMTDALAELGGADSLRPIPGMGPGFYESGPPLPEESAPAVTVIERLRAALDRAEYQPGDSPVVPVKIAAFVDEVRAALTADSVSPERAELIERLRFLASPHAERMVDGYRLTEFCIKVNRLLDALTADSVSAGTEPVAWRYRHLHPTQEELVRGHPWHVAFSNPRATAEDLGVELGAVEPLYTRAALASAEAELALRAAPSEEGEISNERLAEILEGCEGVTPGPWRAEHQPFGSAIYINGGKTFATAHGSAALTREEFPHVSTGAHIARLDPATVRALITELLARRRARNDSEPKP